MSEGIAEMAGTDAWVGLLAETRQALATLRAEDMEQLAARAERMLAATGAGPRLVARPAARPVGRPEDHPANTVRLAAEHRLLGDLLLATGRNLEVLRRLRNRMQARMQVGEGNSRWEL